MRRHRCILREAEDISAFLYQASGMIPGYTQYSPGAANLAYDVLELEGVTLLWARNQAHCRWQDQMSDNGHVHFGFALSAETGVLSMGRALGATDAMLFLPRQEMDYVFLGPVQTLEVAVHGDLVDALGWRFRGSPLARLRAQPLERVKALSARAHALSRARGRMASTPRAVELRDALLDALESRVLMDREIATMEPNYRVEIAPLPEAGNGD